MRIVVTGILAALLVALCSQSYAHEGSVRGIVADNGGQTVNNASVVIDSNVFVTTTDASGKFLVKGIIPGKHSIRLSHVSFETLTNTIVVEDGVTTELSYKLQNAAIEMKGVAIHRFRDEKLTTISISDMKLKNANSTQELLRLVPGLFLSQHQGGGKAEQIFIRGFDCDHGTDINISVDGMPVNMVSHAHGQGYADAHFIVPESVQQLDYGKGPYDIEKGNFCTGGSVSFKTKTTLADNFVTTEAGMYNYLRTAAGINLLKPGKPGANNDECYALGEYLYNRGYFDAPQDLKRFSGMAKYTMNRLPGKKLSLTISGFRSSWDASGQVPERAVREGITGIYGSLDEESGSTSRYNANLEYQQRINDDALFTANLYAVKYDFLLYSNFTYFASDSMNGDQIRQAESRILYGYNAGYTSTGRLGWLRFTTQAGTSARFDDVANSELSHTAGRSLLLNRIAYGDIHELNLSGYISEKAQLSSNLSLSAGARYDLFVQQYTNKLSTDHPGANASNGVVSPKATLSYTIGPALRIYYSYGTGFHSNDTRTIQLGRQLNGAVAIDHILPRAFGHDIGMELITARKFSLAAALWVLDLQQEFSYSGDAAVIDTSGKTRRYGVDLSANYQPVNWLSLYLNVNYAHSRYREEPDGENYIPLSPVLTSTGGVACTLSKSLSAKLGYRYMSDRSADNNSSLIAKGYALFDAAVTYNTSRFQYSAQVQNLFNTVWREAQFATQTRLRNEVMAGQPAQTDICFTPGIPFFLKLSATYRF